MQGAKVTKGLRGGVMNDKGKVVYDLKEIFIFMILVMSSFEFMRTFTEYRLAQWFWHTVNIIFPSVIACLVAYFLLDQYRQFSERFNEEMKKMTKIGNELKEKINS